MARRLLAGVVVATALAAVGPAVAGHESLLSSAKVIDHHVVLELSLSDLRPVEFIAAKRRTVDVDGALLAKNVRLREAIHLGGSVGTVVRWRSHVTLRPGVYFVQVMAVETGGVTDCPPKMPKCGVEFSNVRRVVVPAPK